MIRMRRPDRHPTRHTGAARRGAIAARALILALVTVATLVGPAAGATERSAEQPRLWLGAGIGYSRATARLFRLDGTYTTAGHGFNDGVLRIGYHLDPHWAIEVGFQSWDEDGGPYKQIDLQLVTAGLAWYSGGPFARLELAYGHVETVTGVADLAGPDEPRQVIALPGEDDMLGFAAGVGYRFFLARSLTLTLEVEGAWLPRHENLNVLYGTVNAVLGYFVW